MIVSFLAAWAMDTAPLTIETLDPGAQVAAVYLVQGKRQEAACVTPCTLDIPKGSPFRVVVGRAGWKAAPFPSVKWKSTAAGLQLTPNRVSVDMTKED